MNEEVKEFCEKNHIKYNEDYYFYGNDDNKFLCKKYHRKHKRKYLEENYIKKDRKEYIL